MRHLYYNSFKICSCIIVAVPSGERANVPAFYQQLSPKSKTEREKQKKKTKSNKQIRSDVARKNGKKRKSPQS